MSSVPRFPDHPIHKLRDYPIARFPDYPIPKLPNYPIPRFPGFPGFYSSRWTVAGEKAGRQTAMYSAPSAPGVL